MLELRLVNNTLYTLVDISDALVDGSETVRLTAFSQSGKEVSSRGVQVTGTYIEEAVVGSNAWS